MLCESPLLFIFRPTYSANCRETLIIIIFDVYKFRAANYDTIYENLNNASYQNFYFLQWLYVTIYIRCFISLLRFSNKTYST